MGAGLIEQGLQQPAANAATTLAGGHQIWWVAHVASFVLFLAILPVTMLRHMFTSPLNMYLRDKERPKGAMKPMPNLMETELETFGASTVEDFTWKQLFDAGVFTNPQFQVVVRALSQHKGVDLVSAPKVTTKSGQRATIDIIREFRYPSEYDLPQTTQPAGTILTPSTPTSPTAFETKNVGITLEVEPTVGPDNFSIDLVLAPRVVEFEGFINYGSPIFTVASTIPDAIAIPPIPAISQQVLLTDNIINRPVFSTREVTTEVTVYDGQTVVLGGLLREDVQKVQDKVPILGDIPIAGRLFRSSADQHVKRNLIMFVTASLIDPAGQPLIKVDEEMEEIAAPSAEGLTEEAIAGDALTIPLPE